jgi:hypothetical protein
LDLTAYLKLRHRAGSLREKEKYGSSPYTYNGALSTFSTEKRSLYTEERRQKSPFCSVADPGCLSLIPDPDFYPSRIPDPGSRIPDPGSKNRYKERGEKKIFVKHFFVATNFTKCKII